MVKNALTSIGNALMMEKLALIMILSKWWNFFSCLKSSFGSKPKYSSLYYIHPLLEIINHWQNDNFSIKNHTDYASNLYGACLPNLFRNWIGWIFNEPFSLAVFSCFEFIHILQRFLKVTLADTWKFHIQPSILLTTFLLSTLITRIWWINLLWPILSPHYYLWHCHLDLLVQINFI